MEVMLFGDSRTNRGSQIIDGQGRCLALDLLHHHHHFLPRILDGESPCAPAPKQPVALLYGSLNILRVVISASNDEQVLQTPGDKDFTVSDEPEVTGPQERPFSRIAKCRAKRARSFLRIVPISLGGAGSGQPDFTDLLHGTAGQGFRMGDDHPGITHRSTASNDLPDGSDTGLGFRHHPRSNVAGSRDSTVGATLSRFKEINRVYSAIP